MYSGAYSRKGTLNFICLTHEFHKVFKFLTHFSPLFDSIWKTIHQKQHGDRSIFTPAGVNIMSLNVSKKAAGDMK